MKTLTTMILGSALMLGSAFAAQTNKPATSGDKTAPTTEKKNKKHGKKGVKKAAPATTPAAPSK
jgi:hypothetical protein